jgi:hypothetical protein
METIVLIPKVIKNYIGQFPETMHNAYRYFNYDNRVVNERAETRFDTQACYKGPEDLTNDDYDNIVKYAKTLCNPILMKYSPKVAYEDALHTAIKSFNRGIYDGKINASKYGVLLTTMLQPEPMQMPVKQLPMPMMNPIQTVMAKLLKKKEIKKKEKPITRNVLKQLGVNPKDVPLHSQVHRKVQKGVPYLEKHPGKGIMVKKSAEGGAPNDYLVNFLSLVSQLPTKDFEIIRKLVGRWKQSKVLVREFLTNSVKEAGIDPEYAQKIAEDFKIASAVMDKLEKVYDDICKFDMEKIKTYFEPLQDLVQKIQSKEQESEQPEQSEQPAQPEETSEIPEENQPE